MWSTNIIFKKQINLIFIIIKICHYWLTTLVARQAFNLSTTLEAKRNYQLDDWHSETSTNIAIILINPIHKEFDKWWSSCFAYASAYSKTLSQTLWKPDQVFCLRISS